jgi:hypothetical protein
VLATALLPRLLLTGLLALLTGLLLSALLLLAAVLLAGLLLAALLLTAVLLAALLRAALPTLIGIVHDRSCSETAPRRLENCRAEGWFPSDGIMLPLSAAQSQIPGTSRAPEG